MFIEEFAKKYNFKPQDKRIAMKVYAGQEKTEQEWFNKLEKEYHFQDSEKLRKVREIVAKKEVKKVIEADTKSTSKSTSKRTKGK